MTKWLRDLPIRRKLALLITIAGGVALVLSTLTLLVFKSFDLRQETVSDISTLADMIGSNTTAALTFQDRRAAEETLRALRADPRIACAAVFAKDGSLFARYDRPRDSRRFAVRIRQFSCLLRDGCTGGYAEGAQGSNGF